MRDGLPKVGARLVLDAGNTRVKWALVHDGVFVANGAVPTQDPDALAEAWRALSLQGVRSLACSVASPMVRDRIGALVSAHTATDVVWFASTERCAGVYNRYERPTQLGADRWAALVGARARTDDPVVVVNAGTAITVDALASTGEFLGGLILPGVGVMLDALAQRTAGLQSRPGRFSDFPRNTADAMTSGALDAAAGAVGRMVGRLAAREGAMPGVLLSGGSAPTLVSGMPEGTLRVEHLVLEGLLVADVSEVFR
jgi:type III pantothenate kinase